MTPQQRAVLDALCRPGSEWAYAPEVRAALARIDALEQGAVPPAQMQGWLSQVDPSKPMEVRLASFVTTLLRERHHG